MQGEEVGAVAAGGSDESYAHEQMVVVVLLLLLLLSVVAVQDFSLIVLLNGFVTPSLALILRIVVVEEVEGVHARTLVVALQGEWEKGGHRRMRMRGQVQWQQVVVLALFFLRNWVEWVLLMVFVLHPGGQVLLWAVQEAEEGVSMMSLLVCEGQRCGGSLLSGPLHAQKYTINSDTVLGCCIGEKSV